MSRFVLHRARLIALGLSAFLFTALTHAQTDMLVAAFEADAVLRYHGITGAPMGIFASHASLDGAASITYGSDGNLYVLGEFSHNVLRFDGLTGAFLGEFISEMDMTKTGLTDPGFMEFGPDGNLYILHHFSGLPDAVFKFDGTTGEFISTFATGSGMVHSHGLDFGSDGHLYLGRLGLGDPVIRRYDGAGVLVDDIGPDAGFSGTSSIVFGPDGLLYSTTVSTGGVIRSDPSTGMTDAFIAGGPTWGLLINGTIVYVGYTFEGAIRKYDLATGDLLGDFVAPGGVSTPFDMEFMLIPEPGTIPLILIAVSLLWIRARFRRSKIAQ